MSKVLLHDKEKLKGEFSISLDFHDGKGRLPYFQESNLIVRAAKLYLLQSISLPNIASDPITQLRVGTGGTIDPAGKFPNEEDPYQTNLVATAVSFDVTPTLDTANLSALFLADLDSTQGNGLALSEAGLFKQSGAMFNIKNYPAINKTAAFSVHYEWKITIL